jgi:Glycosyltransferase family 10 (fucosyltransferase) C-term
MNSAKIILKNFWPDGYIGHTDPDGSDLGKKFLLNLFSTLAGDSKTEIEVHSHFFKSNLQDKFRNLRVRVAAIDSDEKMSRRKALYGYAVNKYDLDASKFNIWYTSENLRPPLDTDFDIFLSHDLDSYDGRNLYLPIWVTRLGHDLDQVEMKMKTLTRTKLPDSNKREGICAVISNPEPIRMAFIQELRKHANVDIYGALGMPIDNKMQTLMKYKMNICFENDEFPGYVTEKPFEASEYGCIPIWRGLDQAKYLNPNAMVDVTKLGFVNAIDQVLTIMNDNSNYKKMSSEPILAREFEIQKLRQNVTHLLNNKKL